MQVERRRRYLWCTARSQPGPARFSPRFSPHFLKKPTCRGMCVSELSSGPRSWHRLKATIPAILGEDFGARCFELGSCGVEYEEGLEAEDWIFTAYFDSDKPIERIHTQLALLVADCEGGARARFEIDTEGERDWSTEWRDFLKPVQVSDRIRITQPWNRQALRDGEIEIVIEPKMAFGSGGHESTRLCLMALEEADPAGAACLDVGTGSGVLAITAVLLCARQVTAIDCDPVAADNARENVVLNLGTKVESFERVEVLEGSVEAVASHQYDMVMANIESRYLYSLLTPIERLLAIGGRVLFSGLMARERDEFRQRLKAAGLQVTAEHELNGWMSFTAART